MTIAWGRAKGAKGSDYWSDFFRCSALLPTFALQAATAARKVTEFFLLLDLLAGVFGSCSNMCM